jgi:cytochrome c peroxidase
MDQCSTSQSGPRRCRFPATLGVVACVAIPLLAVSGFRAQEADNKKVAEMASLPRTVPAPKDNPTTADKVTLGRQLFFDPRLSGDNKMSCATCHLPEKSFSDGLPQAKGAGGKVLKRNTPSLLNVGFYSTFLWDGRVRSLEEQALLPIQSPDEMNQNLDELEKKLNAVPGYVSQFQSVFGTRVTRDGIAKALAAFQRTLVTGPSPYDRYLAGDQKALSEEARRGMALFFGDAGCSRCHQGPLLSDEKFYRLGVSQDLGRGVVTGKKEDQYRLRTPSLRNVARTGPYMHDGSQKTLGDVVTYYYRYVPRSGPEGTSLDIEPLLGNSLTEVGDLIAFLESLTGEEPKVSAPKLP